MKTRSATSKAAAKKGSRPSKTVRYGPCPRHARGGVKCAACAKAGLTKAEWAAESAAAHAAKRPHPIERVSASCGRPPLPKKKK